MDTMKYPASLHFKCLLLIVALFGAGTALAMPPSPAAIEALGLIQERRDNEDGPFAVLDKVSARVWVFDASGRPLGSSPVLLGAAKGDDSVPGIGSRPMGSIKPHEKTTPAGRFRVEPGRNLSGEDIFWVDYDAAVSMHRIRGSNPAERRAERMASDTAADNRISYGCINLPREFYEATIRPVFSSGRGWIYVLPETRPIQSLF
jgi:hypothetical protein